ncbi:MAG TPA: hypothetical protein VI818_04835 [Candidatus Thermoplasmatota archaeon]|nr:hypothetical protein [Candidatus Thermoplasmatota archaeon]
MTGLLEVFSAWFRSFGYNTRQDHALHSGAVIPLLIERDARQIGAFMWLRSDAPSNVWLEACGTTSREARCETAIGLSLGPVSDVLKARALREGLQLWDARRIVQELGEAVLAETCPDLWIRNDPLVAARPSKVLAHAQAPAASPAAPVVDAHLEPHFPAPVAPILATPAQMQPAELQVPLSFGILDIAPEPAPGPTPVAAASTPPPAARPARPVLRSQVSRGLASSLSKKKLGSIDRSFLRLVPYHVFDYEAHLLVEGSLDAEIRRGRMAVDAAQRKVLEWTHGLEIGDVASEGADVDEKKVRVSESEAASLLKQELVKVVTRDVVMSEDADEWSVVVKKKVTLGPNDVRVSSLGTFWLPIWRVSGRDGAVEIDAASGSIVFEEQLAPRGDSQLL